MTAITTHWDEWSQPSIEPFMLIDLEFEAGTETIIDDKVASVSFSVSAFDNTSILFGIPVPAEGTIEIIDYDQVYNPVLNDKLVVNVPITLYLCLYPQLDASSLYGPNIVSSFEQPIEVEYLGNTTWATVISIDDTYLLPNNHYRLTYEYTLASTNEELVESFIVPGSWFERHIYAITLPEEYTVQSISINELEALQQPYGKFYAQEWSYDTISHTATIDVQDAMQDMLTLDNRVDGLAPATSQDLLTFAETLFALYSSLSTDVTYEASTDTLLYSFYLDTMSETVRELTEACMSWLYFGPDGSLIHCGYNGAYTSDIIITDDDVESYDIKQSSAATYDSALVKYTPPYLEVRELISLEEIDLTSGQFLSFSSPKVFDVLYTYGSFSSTSAYWYYYSYNILGIQGTSTQHYRFFKTIGRVVSGETLIPSTYTGQVPYEINNGYIQSETYASLIQSTIEQFLAITYSIVKLTLRGCSALWPGVIVHIISDLYSIDADYVIIDVQFNYTGGVRTTLTLQHLLLQED